MKINRKVESLVLQIHKRSPRKQRLSNYYLLNEMKRLKMIKKIIERMHKCSGKFHKTWSSCSLNISIQSFCISCWNPLKKWELCWRIWKQMMNYIASLWSIRRNDSFKKKVWWNKNLSIKSVIGNKMNKCDNIIIHNPYILSTWNKFFSCLLPIFIINNYKIQL